MSAQTIPDLPCLCGSLRRASRALTQRYEKALRPLGLRATQLTILQVLARAGEVSQGELGGMLAMDSTSLTRTLAIMRRQGWVRERRGRDRRERWLRLAQAGENKLARVAPVWEQVQGELRSQLGPQGSRSLLQLTREIVSLAAREGDAL
jgi:DNA-binding MarR family transcriptional regulator